MIKEMSNLLKTPIIIFVLLGITFTISCKKENQNPTVRFSEPENNTILEQDTILTIVIDANDPDGDIKKVQLLINGSIADEFDSRPYQFDWHDSTIENEGVYIFRAIAYDDQGATEQTEISVEIKDYRTKYLGDFDFKVIKSSWVFGESITYDTLFYDGEIRKYKLIDSENDLFDSDDSNENPNEKITIEFISTGNITSLLNSDGSLVSKSGYHYYHSGGYSDFDTINFNINGLGGLGSGCDYEVEGVRK